MNYDDACKKWYDRFLEAAKKKRGITKEEFLKKTEVCTTNGCCYYKGTKTPSPQKLSVMCNQLDIPIEEIFFPKPKLSTKTKNLKTKTHGRRKKRI